MPWMSTSWRWSSWHAGAACPAERVRFHAFTDGRDTPPTLGGRLPARARGARSAVTRAGRDRQRSLLRHGPRQPLGAHPARVRRHGSRRRDARRATAIDAIADAYARHESDEFIVPTVVDGASPAAPATVRPSQLPGRPRAAAVPRARAIRSSPRFDRGAAPFPLTTLTEYQAADELPARVAFPPLVIDSLAAELGRRGMRQLHVAETEKYAHVTYFFNGGVEDPPARRGASPGAVEPRRSRPTTWRRR